jgi:hypothetical protein
MTVSGCYLFAYIFYRLSTERVGLEGLVPAFFGAIFGGLVGLLAAMVVVWNVDFFPFIGG